MDIDSKIDEVETLERIAMYWHDPADRDAIAAELDTLGGIEVTRSYAMNIEVMGEGATKGTALTWLCEHLGERLADAWAFGDNINDIPMLQAAGHGMAMINAEPEDREAADAITEYDNDHDASPAPSCRSRLVIGQSLRTFLNDESLGTLFAKKLQELSPTAGRKETSPSAGLSETLQHATELLLDGVVAVTTHHAIGHRLERGARVFHRAARADKANDLVVVHRVTKRHNLVATNAVMLRELRDTRGLRHTGLHGIDPRVTRRRKSKELTKFAL